MLLRFSDIHTRIVRWDPDMQDPTFLHQSALLYSSYYHLQITLHRSFIPIPSKTEANFLPSLTICTNAARSCVHLLEVEQSRNVPGAFHNLVCVSTKPGILCLTRLRHQIALFNAGIVLVLNIWANKHSNLARSATPKELSDIMKVLVMLKSIEPRCVSSISPLYLLNVDLRRRFPVAGKVE